MTNLQELLKQQAALQRQIEQCQSATRAGAIAAVVELMNKHGLTALDLAHPAAKAKKQAGNSGSRKPVAAKYRSDAGDSWSGRGLKPRWLTLELSKGRRLEEFAL